MKHPRPISTWPVLTATALITTLSIYGCFGDMTSTTPSLTEQQKSDIRDVIEAVRRCRHIPGLSLSVVSSKDVLWKEGFGVSDVENEVPVRTDTLFPVGSTTKAFTATLLAMLIERHPERLSWDSPVSNVLGPDFQLYNSSLTSQVTLRDLLSHRTGIPGYFVPLMAGYPESMTRSQLVKTLRYFEPTAPLRSSFQYNNFMYMLAGHVAEVLVGEDWEQMNSERLFQPLGMSSSTYVRDILDDSPMAESFTIVDGKLAKISRTTLHQVDIAGPAGAIVSNADDMSHWLQFHLRGGQTPSNQYLLTPGALRQTYDETVPSPWPMSQRDLLRPMYPVSDIHAAYDLGWMTNYYRGYKRVWHSGGITNYKSMVWLYPDVDVGLFLCENGPGDGGSTWAMILILQYISDILLNESPWLNETTICSFPEPWATVPEYSMTQPDDEHDGSLLKYVGEYSHPVFPDVVITHQQHQNRTKRLRMRMGRFLEADLHYSNATDTFHTKFVGELWYVPESIPVTFVRTSTSDAKPSLLLMPFDNPYDTAKRVTFARKGEDYAKFFSSLETESGTPCSRSSSILPHLSTLIITVINAIIYEIRT